MKDKGEKNKDEATRKLFETILKVYKPDNVGDVQELMDYAESLDSWSLVGIVTSTSGHLEQGGDNVPSFITEEYVYQYTNGGYSGDSYSGFTYLRLSETDFLKFHYDM